MSEREKWINKQNVFLVVFENWFYVIFTCNCCLCVRSKQYGRFMCRRAQFREALDEIEANVKNVCSGSLTVNYRQAIGGGYYVSVTSGFFCVDIRKFFVLYGGAEEKPTRQGIALRLREWSQIRKLFQQLMAVKSRLCI